jgi:hypothetical protein
VRNPLQPPRSIARRHPPTAPCVRVRSWARECKGQRHECAPRSLQRVRPDVDFERLRDAYANAWRARGSGDDDEILIEELDALADDVFGGPGPGRDLILALWERGVPPEALGRELVRSVPGLAWSWFASSARAVVEVARQLRLQGT